MLGFGWCHIRSSREAYRNAKLEQVDEIDKIINQEDDRIFKSFRKFMETVDDPFIIWNFAEHLNNDHGLLTFAVSRNHRSSGIWEVLNWIAKNAAGSYGLFYCHDDEDMMDRNAYNRFPPMDYDNIFRVHRILNGKLEELADPFFGPIEGNIDPIHPYNRSDLNLDD